MSHRESRLENIVWISERPCKTPASRSVGLLRLVDYERIGRLLSEPPILLTLFCGHSLLDAGAGTRLVKRLEEAVSQFDASRN
jgi:hypothetical protein